MHGDSDKPPNFWRVRIIQEIIDLSYKSYIIYIEVSIDTSVFGINQKVENKKNERRNNSFATR